MKKSLIIILIIFFMLSCNKYQKDNNINQTQSVADVEERKNMKITINDKVVPVIWEDNDSVQELRKLAKNGLHISMSMYGGFEQVGDIGVDLIKNDVQITTSPGDIVLYSSNKLVIFYGTNSYAYTRLGKIDLPKNELEALLSNGDVTVDIELE